MKKNNSHATKAKTKIQCVEVLVSKDFVLRNGYNLHWTLSVYSLENEPVKKNLASGDSAVFHFMVYDWNRTIKQLLDEHQVPYSIVQFFTPETLFPAISGTYTLPEDETSLFLALRKVEHLTGQSSPANRDVLEEEDAHLILP